MDRPVRVSSLFHRVGLGSVIGFILFLLGATVATVLNRNNIAGFRLYMDDVILGLLAGVLVFVYEQRRHRVLLDKIRVIADMNHHVRNALQAMALAPYAEQSKQIQMMDEAAKRIQWALREILPGEVEPVQMPSEKPVHKTER